MVLKNLRTGQITFSGNCRLFHENHWFSEGFGGGERTRGSLIKPSNPNNNELASGMAGLGFLRTVVICWNRVVDVFRHMAMNPKNRPR